MRLETTTWADVVVQWDAYPVLPPTSTFPPIKLAKGLFYVNAFEPCVLPRWSHRALDG